MKTTADFLDDLRRKFSAGSDYKLAPILGMRRQQISHYRLLKGSFDDAVSVRVAELLKIDPAYVIACMHAQRTDDKQLRSIWQRIADQSTTLTACFLAVVCASYLVPGLTVENGLQISALTAMPFGPTVYYVKLAQENKRHHPGDFHPYNQMVATVPSHRTISSRGNNGAIRMATARMDGLRRTLG